MDWRRRIGGRQREMARQVQRGRKMAVVGVMALGGGHDLEDLRSGHTVMGGAAELRWPCRVLEVAGAPSRTGD